MKNNNINEDNDYLNSNNEKDYINYLMKIKMQMKLLQMF